jgi:cephalosporin hydroxylase
MDEFEKVKKENIGRMGRDEDLRELTHRWFIESCKHRYSYNFKWMGRPIIQYPQDILAMHEIIWEVKPQLIIETGIAHGGSLVFYASMLELIGNGGKALGIDIDIRPHNRTAIEQHPMFKNIEMIEGSSVNPAVVERVYDFAKGKGPVLVTLDSNHTRQHVASELELYSPLVTRDSYLVVFDTVVEDMPDDFFQERPWGQGNNPKTAVRQFLKNNDRFVADEEFEAKLLITVAPEGYLRCVKD